MGIIKDKKKFERTKKQKDPTQPKVNKKTNEFDIDKKTIKKQQNKH
ncbi:hypothetical protein CJ739_2601 [Mariniflexile rhizosphaerae]|nr:hypothetical protein [Mariniflexile sp. TRM1-10]AXP81674.1 hypothetical protein CJ739_2601 [Mariniflexile sp. TRM1-10]PLB18088.1 MAG: hypothetical protein TRG1_3101 [Flavobacteriaceae bacterium FS1-H7996/R]